MVLFVQYDIIQTITITYWPKILLLGVLHVLLQGKGFFILLLLSQAVVFQSYQYASSLSRHHFLVYHKVLCSILCMPPTTLVEC